MAITPEDFEKLPKEEQTFRWALFRASNGYEKELSSERIAELKQKYLIEKQPLPKGYTNKV